MFGIIFLCLYLIPTTVAAKRNHHNMLAIFMLNLLGGWTFIGWAAALIWACTAVKSK
ncbi:superinfection immunity protein [Aeromonas veronii]|nr:superinfection immunity protein [Aeromonas veronii]